MARTVLNSAIQYISGRLDQYVFRHQPDGSVTLAKASLSNPNRELSAAQLAQLQRFKQAAARRRHILEDPHTAAAYEYLCAARGPMARLHTLVIGDAMKPPAAPTLDLSAYHGGIGDTIRIVAEDNLAVARLTLAIHDLTTGTDLETDENAPPIERLAPTLEWLYTAHTSLPAGHPIEIRVSAFDLAGNQTDIRQSVLYPMT